MGTHYKVILSMALPLGILNFASQIKDLGKHYKVILSMALPLGILNFASQIKDLGKIRTGRGAAE